VEDEVDTEYSVPDGLNDFFRIDSSSKEEDECTNDKSGSVSDSTMGL
jgi:hypothetical protein